MSALTQSGHRVGRWRSAGAVAEALSVNAKMVVPKRPGRFYGVRCQFLVPILCFDVGLREQQKAERAENCGSIFLTAAPLKMGRTVTD
jgi:hypothetical protein